MWSPTSSPCKSTRKTKSFLAIDSKNHPAIQCPQRLTCRQAPRSVMLRTATDLSGDVALSCWRCLYEAYRDVATLAGAQIICFLILTHLEPGLFVIHFYEAILYIAILVMLFYMEDRWAYMIGMLASGAWLVLAFLSGNIWRHFSRAVSAANSCVRRRRNSHACLADGTDRRFDDRGMWPALDEGILGTRAVRQHFRREPWMRRGVLRNPGAVFLGHDSHAGKSPGELNSDQHQFRCETDTNNEDIPR